MGSGGERVSGIDGWMAEINKEGQWRMGLLLTLFFLYFEC